MTKIFSFAVWNIGVAYRENLDRVMTVLEELGAQLQTDPSFGPYILGALDMGGVDQFGDSAVVIKCRIKTKAGKLWRITRELNHRIKLAFGAQGIEILFPHRTIYWWNANSGDIS